MTEQTEARTRRTPLGGPKAKLGGKEFIEAGHVGRWINDKAGRIAQAQAAGYKHVEEKNGERGRGAKVKRQVGTKENGEPLLAYLMQIPRKFYDEDQAAKLAPVNEMEAAILSGKARGEGVNQSEFYVPKEGIKLES